MKPVRMTRRALEKVWGTPDTAPWWDSHGKKIGEVWYGVEGESLDLLLKLIFTSERLSVQVHPGDEYAAHADNSLGKTEMWHILRAAPGAALACGLKKEITRQRLREVSLSGEIEGLLKWIPVKPGDSVFLPAGVIHAIGPGLVLCEVQQQSDVTYRLYDYGRPRQLHLDKAIDVASLKSHPGVLAPVDLGSGARRLAASEYFEVDSIDATGRRAQDGDGQRWEALIVLEGAGRMGTLDVKAGDGVYVPAGAEPFAWDGQMRVLRARVPDARP